MPKQKNAHPSGLKSKSRNQPSNPETAEDALAIGVEFEEAGEKWRAGDAAKSSRMFVRALEAYEIGLKHFPQSFDLAYNRARLQFDIAQQPRLLQHLPYTGTDLLKIALQSHRQALSLNSEDPDALFNTAQILSSLAEEALEESEPPELGEKEAKALLGDAIISFEKCLTLQEERYRIQEETIASFASIESQENEPSEEMDMENSNDSRDQNSEEKWALIEEPLTRSTLLDTCLAAVNALVTLVPLLSQDQVALQGVEAKSASLLEKAKAYALGLGDESSTLEFHRTEAKRGAVMHQMSFELGMITADQYSQSIDNLFEFVGRDTSVAALMDSAEARVTFNTSCHSLSRALDRAEKTLNLQWSQLSLALKHLSNAANIVSKDTGIADPWIIHARKGDVELLRARLAESPWNYPVAVSNKEMLLNNAEVFYRGAKNLAKAGSEEEKMIDMASREDVVKSLRGQHLSGGIVTGVIQEMREEGLLA